MNSVKLVLTPYMIHAMLNSVFINKNGPLQSLKSLNFIARYKG